MSARRWAAGLGGATVLALTAGCGMLGIGGGEDDQSDEDRLLSILNESNRIESELVTAEHRIVQNCLEEAGFTVHEPYSFQAWEAYEQESLSGGYPHEEFLVDAEEAAEFGFGAWADSAEAQENGEAEEYWTLQEEKWAEEEGEDAWVEPDTTEWDALDPGDQYDWYVAYQGVEYTEDMNGTRDQYISMMSEEELTEEEYEALEEGAAEEEVVEDEGEIIVEEEEYVEPKPDGCQLEMIEALYGEPTLVEETYEEEGGGGSYSYWTYRPENPTYGSGEEDTMYDDISADYAAAIGDLQGEYLDCITERGYADFEFDEYGSLPVRMWLNEIYYDGVPEDERMMSYGDDGTELPALPDDMPADYEAKKAFEIQMAVDFGECGEETGYAAASEKAYDEANVKAYTAVEDDLYAWQQDMQDALTKAQEMLDQ
ncbi:hypothetical protein [Glycomyces algeriensis]|uniref:Uncharacterized protein n=1 Tax=Glycomyces algeriensis TaxID=256037 RepID=A0A9W6G6H1_9ACTN|nr:hypothetical protein [Glycomyces algeriensis]MDA1365901.1 hypothetical protein [Glycomyces algeriensis]MDR7349333.1 hypothetical protein [Glycomyces algeriensis]GLI42034.1 hypothetical protein GALLR39Z86_18840 [Glycomyces algeriensis]